MSKPFPFQTILFDIDGVLVDVSGSYRRAIEETVAHFTGREISSGTIQRYKNLGGFNDDWKLTHAVITDTGISVPFKRIVTEFQKRYRGEDWDGFISEEPPLIDTGTLDKLASTGAVMGVVTGRPEAEARWTIENLGWKKYFPLIVAREKQEGRGKPDPFPLQHALTILAAAGRTIEPEDAVYIGDTVDDIDAAKAAGMWSVGVVPPYVDSAAHRQLLFEHGADEVTDRTDQLPKILRDLKRSTERVEGNNAA